MSENNREENQDLIEAKKSRMKLTSKKIYSEQIESWWKRILRPTNGLITLVLVGLISGLFGLVASMGWFKTGLKTNIALSGISELDMNKIGPNTRQELQSRLNIDKYLEFQDEVKLTQASTAIEVNRLRNLLVTFMIFALWIFSALVYAVIMLAQRVTEAEGDRAHLSQQIASLTDKLTRVAGQVDGLNSKVSKAEEAQQRYNNIFDSLQQAQGDVSERLTHTIELLINSLTILGSRAQGDESEEQKQEREKREESDYHHCLKSLQEMVMVQLPAAAKTSPPLTEKNEATNL